MAGTTLAAKDESGSKSGYEYEFGLSPFNFSPSQIGQKAAEKAISKLGSKHYHTGKASLVLDPEITADLFGVFANTFFADEVLKGKSFLKGKLDQKIASDKIVLIDDGTIPGAACTTPVDGEGIATGKTILIEDGYLLGFLNDFRSARKMNIKPSGNASRSYKSLPRIEPTNLYLKPGSVSKYDLISSVKKGLYIDEVMGLHSINLISGEFSLGASGRVIENGSFSYPVEGIAIAGNITDLLNSVTEVASDLKFFPNGGGGCTILLEGISVSGK